MKKALIWLIALIAACTMLYARVYADTDGTEIQITDQPEHLTLRLGQQWAGVKFQLKTDMGVFPVPVVVNQFGVLQMDLGGSKTYVLTSLTSPAAESQTEQPSATTIPSITPTAPPDNSGEIKAGDIITGKPVILLILFVIGFTVAVGMLIELWFYWRRKKSAKRQNESDFK